MNNVKFLYHQNYFEFEKNPQTQKVLNWINHNEKILEFGCHTGLLSRALVETKKCVVVGIDINKEALKIAEKFQSETFCFNIEDYNQWYKVLKNQVFDSITFLHILEHLRNPQEVLQHSLDLLKPNGMVIIGLPNVSNAKDRFDMTFGKFEYTEIGVMDRTHVHMFNYKTAIKFIEDAGLVIEEYFSPWQVNPIKHFFDHLPVLLRFAKTMSEKPPRLFKFSPNITDTIMLFKCKLKSK